MGSIDAIDRFHAIDCYPLKLYDLLYNRVTITDKRIMYTFKLWINKLLYFFRNISVEHCVWVLHDAYEWISV